MNRYVIYGPFHCIACGQKASRTGPKQKYCSSCTKTKKEERLTPEYKCWKGLSTRCLNKGRREYKYYGGRGIAICKRWRTSYSNFLADMGRKPSPHHSLDRINNDGNYDPKNCRWATRQQQRRNSQSVRPIKFNGKTRLLSDWAQILGINKTTLSMRLDKRGWSIKRALTEAVR